MGKVVIRIETSVPRKVITRTDRVRTQSYERIRNECLVSGALWEDPDFPAIDRSVYHSYNPGRSFDWVRPKEICSDPRMFVGGATRFDVKQGDLGNCWFLAAVASLCASGNQSESQDLLDNAIPPDNSFRENYCGVFHFHIWQYGRWLDVVIDDRLPTLDGRLVFMHSAEPNEFWSALLEKAYAKLNGSYEALQGGCSSEAMEDFTGGVVEAFNYTKEVPASMWNILLQAGMRHSLMACQIDAPPTQIESVLDNGLIIGHAYSVTAIKEINVGSNKVKLLRVRNPWGNQYEWKGAWSDSDPQWNQVPANIRETMGLQFESDGEFWMSFDDFVRNYQKLEICNLGPESLVTESAAKRKKRRWEASMHDGSWRSKVNAGGCRNFLDTFWTNPQYRTEVVDPDEDDDENMGTLIVALMQKERRKKKREGLDYLTIGLSVYRLKDPSCGPLDLNFFKYNAAVARSTFTNMREVCQRFKLPPGHYVIIPSTFNPNQEGDFLLRIYSERPTNTGEIDEETGLDEEGEIQIVNGIHVQDEKTMRRQRARLVTDEDANQEREVRAIFRRTSGEDMEVDASELRSILDAQFMREFKFDGFSIDTCRSMVAMMDEDRSSKLGYDEFKTLWGQLRMWKKIFKEFDLDHNGILNGYELRQALNSAGIKVSNSTLNGLVMRYADKDGKIYFDEFIHCAIRLKIMFDTFKAAKPDPNGPAQFSMEKFIQTTMYS